MNRPAPGAEDPEPAEAGEAIGDSGGDHVGLDHDWLRPEPGTRIRQTVPHGPFVAQHRHDLGLGACRLTRHRGAVETEFTLLGYSERSEIGLPCHVVHLRDESDGREYVVDTGLAGPGLPPDAFHQVDPGGADLTAEAPSAPG